MKIRIRILSILAPIIALFTAVLICSAILNFIDRDPVETFRSMFEYGTSGKSIVSIINRSVPLYISAVAVAVGFKMGLFNIGVEGQYLLGALLAAAFGSYFALPPAIHILFILFVALLSSGLWAGIAGYLKVKKGIHEVISTIMLNYIGTGIIAYLLAQVFFEKDENSKNSCRWRKFY